MPTGYTAALENMNYDLKRWLKESIIRSMGICVSLRESIDMTEEELKEHFEQEETESYYKKALKAKKEELAEYSDKNFNWEKHFNEKQLEAKNDYDKRVIEYTKKKEQHLKCIKDIETLAKKADNKGELIKKAINFGLEQLHQAYQFDYDYFPSKASILNMSLENFKQNTLDFIKREIRHYSEEVLKESSRNASSQMAYNEYVTFINNNL